jgi:hypothetical protein
MNTTTRTTKYGQTGPVSTHELAERLKFAVDALQLDDPRRALIVRTIARDTLSAGKRGIAE